jgi:hypothetical protein
MVKDLNLEYIKNTQNSIKNGQLFVHMLQQRRHKDGKPMQISIGKDV